MFTLGGVMSEKVQKVRRAMIYLQSSRSKNMHYEFVHTCKVRGFNGRPAAKRDMQA